MSTPFDSYATLLATIADWLNRQDLTAAIPSFIALCEAEVNADDRFRTQPSVVRAQAPINGQFVPLPSDYIAMLNFRILQAPPPGHVEFVTITQADDFRQVYQVAGRPKKYTIVGDEMELLPAPDQIYTAEMAYYAHLPALSVANQTNWLLRSYPNVYLYGALLQAAPYLKDDARVGTWATLYEAAANKIEVSNDRAQFSGSTLKMRTRRYR